MNFRKIVLSTVLIISAISISAILVSSDTVPVFGYESPLELHTAEHHEKNLDKDTRAILLEFSGNGGSADYMKKSLGPLEEFMINNEGAHHDSSWNKFHYPMDGRYINFDATKSGQPASANCEPCHWNDAKADALEYINANPQKKIIIAGYSFGGGTATFLADELQKIGREVEGLFLTDPVGPGVTGSSRNAIAQVCNNAYPIDSFCTEGNPFPSCGDHGPFRFVGGGIICGKNIIPPDCPAGYGRVVAVAPETIVPKFDEAGNRLPDGKINDPYLLCIADIDKKCPEGTKLNQPKTACFKDNSDEDNSICPAGTDRIVAGICIHNGVDSSRKCPAGTELNIPGTACVADANCPAGTDRIVAGLCIGAYDLFCPSGMAPNAVNTQCISSPGCNYGGHMEGTLCRDSISHGPHCHGNVWAGSCWRAGTGITIAYHTACDPGYNMIHPGQTYAYCVDYSPDCPGGTDYQAGGLCISTYDKECPSGLQPNAAATECISTPACPAGTHPSGGLCAGNGTFDCPADMHLNAPMTECISTPACPAGTNPSGPLCAGDFTTSCPAGMDFNDPKTECISGAKAPASCPVDTEFNLSKTQCVVKPSVINGIIDVGAANTCPFGMVERAINECGPADNLDREPNRIMNANVKGIYVVVQKEGLPPTDYSYDIDKWRPHVTGKFEPKEFMDGGCDNQGDAELIASQFSGKCHGEVAAPEKIELQTEFITFLKGHNEEPTIELVGGTDYEVFPGESFEIKTVSTDPVAYSAEVYKEKIENMKLYPRLDSLDNGVEPSSQEVESQNGNTIEKHATFVINIDDAAVPGTITRTVWVEDNGWPCDDCSTEDEREKNGGATGKWNKVDFTITIKSVQDGPPVGDPLPPGDVLTAQELSIPKWVKNTAGWWSDKAVEDSDFTGGISYLIEEGIISIPDLPAATEAAEENVPEWVRDLAGWWSDDLTTDQEFADAIKYLVEKGIIQVQT